MDRFPFNIDDNQITCILLIFTRVGTTINFLPLFGSMVPVFGRILFSFIVSIIFYQSSTFSLSFLEIFDILDLLIAIFTEFLIGISIAMIVQLIFSGIQLAGYIIGFQIGFSIVNIFDPVTGEDFSIMTQFINTFTILLFIVTDLHHLLLNAIFSSFELIPLAFLNIDIEDGKNFLIYLVKDLFVIAIKLSSPLFTTLLLKQFAMGILSRVVPQMNIFIVGFPVTIGFGLFAFSFLMIYYQHAILTLFFKMIENIDSFITLAS